MIQRALGAILRFQFVIDRTQLNAVHTQLLKKLRLGAFTETCQFQRIHSLEFRKIINRQKKVQKPCE